MDSRYRRRATLVFGPNKQRGADPVALEDGRAVFWKGNPRDIRYGEPVECVVADAQHVSFALPVYAPPEESGKAVVEDEQRKPDPARRDGEKPKKVKSKTGLKRVQLVAVKEVAEKRARKAASEEVKVALAFAADLQRQMKDVLEEMARSRTSAEVAITESSTAREAIGEFRKGFVDLASRIASAEADLRALKAAVRAPLGAIPKPVPVDPDWPTDEEIERQIVYLLHQQKCYGGKHTSGEHFRTGHLAKVPEKRIREAIKSLSGRGILRRHAKTPEQYSLQSDKKALIAEILRVPDRDLAFGEPEPEPAKTPPSSTNGNGGSRAEDRYVERGPYENTLRGLRERLEALERAHRDLLSTSMGKSEGRALSAQIGKVDDRLATVQPALEAHAVEIASLKKRLDAEVAKAATPDSGGPPRDSG